MKGNSQCKAMQLECLWRNWRHPTMHARSIGKITLFYIFHWEWHICGITILSQRVDRMEKRSIFTKYWAIWDIVFLSISHVVLLYYNTKLKNWDIIQHIRRSSPRAPGNDQPAADPVMMVQHKPAADPLMVAPFLCMKHVCRVHISWYYIVSDVESEVPHSI